MTTFTPPTVNIVPRFLPDSPAQEKALFKFYQPSSAYVQVFLLSDGTFVQNYSTPENQNTNIPYPWNADNPSAPYAYGSYIDYNQYPPVPVQFATGHDVWIVHMYDRPTVITDLTILALLSVQYSGCLS